MALYRALRRCALQKVSTARLEQANGTYATSAWQCVLREGARFFGNVVFMEPFKHASTVSPMSMGLYKTLNVQSKPNIPVQLMSQLLAYLPVVSTFT